MVERMGGVGAVLAEELARAEAVGADARAVILVEGASDQRAIEALAARLGRDLEAERVVVIPMAGATNITRFLEILGPAGHDVKLAGLYDAAEEADIRLALAKAGIGTDLDRARLEQLGFFMCEAHLEAELVRALGVEQMVRLIESQGHIRRFRSFQKQPAHQHEPPDEQIRRWLGNHKIRYAPLMVDALDLAQVPYPMVQVLRRVA